MFNLHIRIDTHDTLGKLDAVLRNMEDATTVIETTADEMVEYMVSLAIGDCPVRTGQLRDSIRVEGSFPSYMIIADAVDKYGVEYGQFVEFGTSMQQAQPFMWPAIDRGVAQYASVFKEVYMAALRGGI